MLLKSKKIKEYAFSIGADLVGIAPASADPQNEKELKKFIQEGRHGTMGWLEDYQKRVNPDALLPGAKSVMVIGINYYRETQKLSPGHGRVARYAYGRDYHKVLKKILKQIMSFMAEQAPNEKFRLCVDSAPILEKAYAQKAGLGFMGKNTLLITKEFGSFVLLGEILTTAVLDYDEPATGTCGTCTRCLDACPTKAITAPGKLDARRCISYLTIENKGEIAEEFRSSIGEWIFGCDICQNVCPYNKVNAKPLTLEAFKSVKIAGESLPLQEIMNIQTDQEFLERFAGSPLMRAKRKGLQRNARIVMENGTKKL